MKKLVHLMRKNKTRRRKIKRFIRQYIPKSSSWHNLLSTKFRKYVSQKPTNVNIWQFKKPCCAIKKTHKLIKKESQKIAIMRTGRTKKHKLCKLNNHKIKNTNKCNMLRIKTSNKLFLFVCGDIELNPGPINTSNMSVLTTRLAHIGRQPVNIVGDGNCFFRSVSHQLYGTEDCHPQIRALAIQHLINCPEHFVEYNTDQSWLQYLQNMSTLGTWADHIIIQAVANKHNLRINITESAPNFSESTTVSSICTGSQTRQRSIYIGHLDELHYVSTTPITQSISTQLINRTTSDKPKEISRNSQSNKTSLKETTSMKNAEKRKQYMKEYMKQKRKKLREKSYIMKTIKIPKPNKLGNLGKKPLQHTEKQILIKLRNYLRRSLPLTEKKTLKKLRNCARKPLQHTEKKTLKKLSLILRKPLQHTGKQILISLRNHARKPLTDTCKSILPRLKNLKSELLWHTEYQILIRLKNPLSKQPKRIEKVAESSRNSSRIYYENYPERVKNIKKNKYLKRKLSYMENEKRGEHKRLKINSQDNLFKTSEETSNDTRLPITIPKAIELFHKNISVGPEYICTCCNQLWYRSSVTQCNASLYQSCSRKILDLCLTGLKSIDKIEWMSFELKSWKTSNLCEGE